MGCAPTATLTATRAARWATRQARGAAPINANAVPMYDARRALGCTPGARRGANANVMPMYDARRALGYTPGAAPIPMV